MAQQSTAPKWILGCGCGCALFAGLVIASIVGAGIFGTSLFKDYVEDMRDPASRTAKATEILGASELPDGYSAHLYFKIPWVFDLVILSDGEPTVLDGDGFELAAENVGENLFVFFALRKGRMDEEEIDEMLAGRRKSNEGVNVDVGIEVDSSERLGEGEFEIASQRISYVANRGSVSLDGDRIPGIYSRILIDCPGDNLTRTGVFFKRDPEDLEGKRPLEIPGSPADEDTLREFLGHFNVCTG